MSLQWEIGSLVVTKDPGVVGTVQNQQVPFQPQLCSDSRHQSSPQILLLLPRGFKGASQLSEAQDKCLTSMSCSQGRWSPEML